MKNNPKLFILFLLNVISSILLAHTENSDQLVYEQNKGQWDKSIIYRAKLKNMDLFYEHSAITIQLYDLHELLANNHPKSRELIISDKSTAYFHSYKINFSGANQQPTITGNNEANYYSNYYIGNDQNKWASHVSSYNQIVYTNLYQGIHLKIYSHDLKSKYDFVVQPNADVTKIKMSYTGVTSITIINDALKIKTSVGEITEEKPYAYQIIKGKQVEVPCQYQLIDNTVGFVFPNGYDNQVELIIDPILVGSTYSGSTADNWGNTATYDNQGNMYAGGIVTDVGYPTTLGAYKTNFGGGGVGGIIAMPWDIAITKYDATGSNRIFATYLGGSENEFPHSMIVNNNDELHVYGKTYSNNFPVTSNAYDKTYNGAADIIVTKFNASGSALLGSTYIGSSADDGVNVNPSASVITSLKYNYGDDARGEITIDNTDAIYIASSTKSNSFPVTLGAYSTTFNGGTQDACVFKLNSDCSALIWSTYLGGSAADAGYALSLDKQKNVYVVGGTSSANFPTTSGTIHPTIRGGIDGYVSKIKFDGSQLLASTFIGTANYDQCYFVQIDNNSNVYLYGQTKGIYPTTAGVYKSTKGGLFIHQLNAALTTTGFSTIIGDGLNYNPNLSPSAFLVDNCGNIYIAGWGGTCSAMTGNQGSTTGLPVTLNAHQKTTDGCDFYLMSLSANATTLTYATFFGSNNTLSGDHLDGGTSRFDKRGVIYHSVCAGCGGYSTFPTTTTAWSKTNNSDNCNNAIFKFDFTTQNVIALSANESGCAPFNVVFDNSSANATSYRWNFGDSSAISTTQKPSHTYTKPGKYTVKLIAENPTTCNQFDSIEIFVVVKAAPIVNLGADIVVPCNNNNPITLSPGAMKGNYTWSTGATSNSIIVNTSGKYWLVVEDEGCELADTVNVSISGKLSVTAFAEDAICSASNGGATAVATVGSPGTYSYSWSNGATSAKINNLTSGTYTVTFSNGGVCLPVTASVSVGQRKETGFVDFQPNQTVGNISNPAFVFNNTSTNLTSWIWHFGDFANSTNSIDYHTNFTYNDTGSYCIKLTGINTNGCIDSAMRCVVVNPEFTLFIPNAFTPNNDDDNQFFLAKGNNVKSFRMIIFNRWGEEIFESDNLYRGWDGTVGNNKTPAQQDVYTYLIIAKELKGKEHQYKGHVTLVR